MLHKCVDCLGSNVLLKPERLDDLSSLGQHVWLNESLVTLKSRPFLTHGHVHNFFVLVHTIIRVRQFLDKVFEGELFVSLLCVKNHSLHLVVDPFVFEVLYPLFPDLLGPLELLLVSIFIDTSPRASPLVPASLHFDSRHLVLQVTLDFVGFFSFELLVNFIVILSNK